MRLFVVKEFKCVTCAQMRWFTRSMGYNGQTIRDDIKIFGQTCEILDISFPKSVGQFEKSVSFDTDEKPITLV